MKNIQEIDKNLSIKSKLEEKDLKFYNVRNDPFKVYGLYKPEQGDRFLRMPEEVAKATNEGVKDLNFCTAGGRVRFKTNSAHIAIFVKQKYITRFSHMPLTGTTGFDMYVKENDEYCYVNSFVPPEDISNGYESIHYFKDSNMHDITINFPLYNDVEELYIGISQKSDVFSGDDYVDIKPIVYYGSSITQGGCASRPGNSYQAIISRRLDCDYVNLGFSGSARAEKAITDYIKALDMSCFVYDYDHNAPDAEYLKKTHKPMFDAVRKENPNLPIIIMSKPVPNDKEEYVRERKNIILDTYNTAINNGDKNVYFIDGTQIFNPFGGDSSTVDGVHPNDLGFMCMANKVCEILNKVFADLL